jgi:alpha-amylase/alpha-mannosidase (GH57 family)
MDLTCITFFWHMHQPLYKKPGEGNYLLPWVRLHAIKDYLDMAMLIESIPTMRAVINVVPSLLVQLEDYIKGSAHDPFLTYSLKPAAELTDSERLFLLKNFFSVNKRRFIDSSARFSELLKKKIEAGWHSEDAINIFDPQDYLDLQVHFNLAWCGPSLKKEPQIASLINKDRNYTQKEKELLLSRQQDVMAKIIPTYKRLQDSGRMEISVSPFYHPLLPLLCDNHAAGIAQPGIKLPSQRFRHPEDADGQIGLALEYYRKLFGKEAQGMWPPEGAVSNEALELTAKHGLKWLITDEAILVKSLAVSKTYDRELAGCLPAEKSCIPYKFKSQKGETSIFFRNQSLSNLISFVYSSWDEEKAADDFYHRLVAMNNSLERSRRPYIISIAMDGENAWEYYPKGGEVFLLSLYHKIANSPQFKPMTFSEFLASTNPKELGLLMYISPGSWIEGNFSTWIGEPKKNEAWDRLFEARKALDDWVTTLSPQEKQQKKDVLHKALQAIYVAEGSDWFWWLKGGEQPESEKQFSVIHKMYMAEMYRILGLEIPVYLKGGD